MEQLIQLDKHYIIHGYTTKLELETLEFLAFNNFTDDDDYELAVDNVLSNCVRNYNTTIPKLAKVILLWVVRMITLGNEISITFTCNSCRKCQSLTANISDLIRLPTRTQGITPKFIETSESYDLIIDFDDEVDIDEYEKVLGTNYNVLYSKNFKFNCQYCNFENIADLLTYKKALTFLSEDSFQNLLNWIHTLVYYGHFTRADILDMSPIQRMIEINYFKETKKEEALNVNNQHGG